MNLALGELVVDFESLGRKDASLFASGTPRIVLAATATAKMLHGGRPSLRRIIEVSGLPSGTLRASRSRVKGLREAMDTIGRGPLDYFATDLAEEVGVLRRFWRSRTPAQVAAWKPRPGASTGCIGSSTDRTCGSTTSSRRCRLGRPSSGSGAYTPRHTRSTSTWRIGWSSIPRNGRRHERRHGRGPVHGAARHDRRRPPVPARVVGREGSVSRSVAARAQGWPPAEGHGGRCGGRGDLRDRRALATTRSRVSRRPNGGRA